jgi:hypothetical protein
MNSTTEHDDDLLVVGTPLPRLAAVRLADPRNLDARRVVVTWRDGTQKLVDLAPALLSHRHFIPLREDNLLFQTVRVDEDGMALEWDDGIEMVGDWIASLPSVGLTNADFREAMDRLNLSLDGMAAQLELSRRQIASYRGTKPIPAHVAFAVRYLVSAKETLPEIMVMEEPDYTLMPREQLEAEIDRLFKSLQEQMAEPLEEADKDAIEKQIVYEVHRQLHVA